jgi:hypothetical protein
LSTEQMSADSRKRKRVISGPIILPSYLPAESINPLSHTPGTLRQFAVAGLSETDVEPSTWIPGFPHRPVKDRDGDDQELNEVGDDEVSGSELDDSADGKGSKQGPRSQGGRGKPSVKEQHRKALRDAICVFLDRGDIALAKRAFALLIRLPTRSSHHGIDLRHENYWSLGAEILMRDGEERLRGRSLDGSERRPGPSRLGLVANITRVRSYFDTLIARHPYNHKLPRAFSALQLYPSLWGYEIYNVHAEQRLALQRLTTEATAWDDDDDDDGEAAGTDDERGPGDGDAAPRLGRREARLRQARDHIRRQALAAITDVTDRMDRVLESTPFSKSADLLRLRGMAALYVGDLLVPEVYRFRSEVEDARRRRLAEQERARKLFERMRGGRLQGGGGSDAEAPSYGRNTEDVGELLSEEDEEEEEMGGPGRQSVPREDLVRGRRRDASEGPLREMFSSLAMFSGGTA